jgi:nucleoside-diphosphate-sugar epimerase
MPTNWAETDIRNAFHWKQDMAEEKFLITGAFGCIGAWAVKRLVEDGTPVYTYDLPGNPHRLKLIMDDAQFSQVNIIEGDITDAEAFDAAVVDNGITNIIHLAALQVPMVRANPILGMRVNVVGSTVVFETARQHMDQVKSVAYASSIAVYGPANLYPKGPVANDAPLMPTTLYGVSKQADEWAAKVYWQENQLKTIGLRPFFVYGPGRDQGMSSLPTKAMLAAAIDRPFNINFGGSAVYQHAEDVAVAFIAAARADIEGAPCFNLGGTVETVPEVIDAIEAAVPSIEGKITYDDIVLPFPESMDDTEVNKALGTLDWRPFKEGVASTISDFQTAIAAGRLDVERAIG